jgi:very-short-patch-repair endonuclease
VQDDGMDVVDALAACGGAARRPDLARLGVDDAALRRASRAGIATQPARGLYALPSADPAHVALLLRRQVLTCISAAPLHGLWVLDSSGPAHVYHRRGEVFDGDVPHGGLFLPPNPNRPVASLGDVLIHALRCLPLRESLIMVECAVGRGDMTVEFLRQRLPGRRNGRARGVLQWVDRGAESMLETLARTCFRQAGITVESQVYIDGVGYVDLLLEGWLVVELDGRHHGDWKQVKKDQRRNNRSVVQGYTVLRYYYADVVHSPEQMLAEVLAVLAERRGGKS